MEADRSGKKINRREFFGAGAAVVASGTALSATNPGPHSAKSIAKALRQAEAAPWRISYGSYERGIEQFAVDDLQRMVQRYLLRAIDVQPATGTSMKDPSQPILVGTAANHPLIAELGERKLIPLPRQSQGYTIGLIRSPWNSGKRVAVIAGADAPGVLYGVQEFNKRLAMYTPGDLVHEALGNVKDFIIHESPSIETRGIWCWGCGIYDYQHFLDNMARLKMNRLTIWNNKPPVNCRELISYAHARGIKVILGFSWGWGPKKIDLGSPADLRTWTDRILREYERDYRHLGMDGIYFQTATETSRTVEDGRTIASLACAWVNHIARALLKEHPGLRIEFGLHATSILKNYVDLKPLDSRIVIVWEDAGVIPYAYDPVLTFPENHGPQGLKAVQTTIDFSKKLATFRPNTEFAMVAKGWTALNWTRVEHPSRLLLAPLGPFILGEWPRAFMVERLQDRQPRWDYVNATWLQNYASALRFFREIRTTSDSPMSVQGLIEDGLFEMHIQVSTVLLGEMLWNLHREEKQYAEFAINPYYYANLTQ